MSRILPALVGFLLAAAPVSADVTPREVWDDWLASMGDAEIAGSVTEEDGSLTVTGLTISKGHEETGRYTIEVQELALVANSDGTVSVRAPSEYPITLTDTDEDGTLRETRLLVRHPDLDMTISDTNAQRIHTFAAPEISVDIEEVTENGAPLDVTGTVMLRNADGRYDAGDQGQGDSVLSAAEVQMGLGGSDAETGNTFDLAVTMRDLDSENMLSMFSPDTVGAVGEMAEGASRDARFRTASSAFTLETEAEGERIQLNGTSGPGKTNLRVAPEGLTYESEGEDTTIALSGGSIPLPQVAVEIGRVSSSLVMPLLAADAPQPFAFSVAMLEVELDEGIWNMFDPAAILPRDPGAIVLDVEGEITVEENLDATQAAEGLTGDIEKVEIRSARVEFADARASATGLLDLIEAGGDPVPVGRIDVTLNGVDKLLERLATAGILPQQQAMATMMMLGAFATPGEREGERKSSIRFSEDGGVFVNEQRVQ